MDVCTLIIKKKVFAVTAWLLWTLRICIHAKTLFLKVFIRLKYPITLNIKPTHDRWCHQIANLCDLTSPGCLLFVLLLSPTLYLYHLCVQLFCFLGARCPTSLGRKKKKERGTAATLGSSRSKHKMHFQCVQTVTSIYSCSRVDCTSLAAWLTW